MISLERQHIVERSPLSQLCHDNTAGRFCNMRGLRSPFVMAANKDKPVFDEDFRDLADEHDTRLFHAPRGCTAVIASPLTTGVNPA